MAKQAERICSVREHPAVKAATDKLSELSREREGIRAEQAEISERMRAHRHRVVNLQAQAAALLDGEDVDAGTSGDQARAQELSERAALLDEAMKMQRLRMEAAEVEVGNELGRERLPEYQAVVERLAAAMAEVGRIANEERAAWDQLERDGARLSSMYRPHGVQSLPGSDPHSFVSLFLRSVREYHGIEVNR